MSGWLRRAKATVAAYCASCGGSDVLSGTERAIIDRATQLADRLEQIEALGDVLDHGLANYSADARLLYFTTAGDLRRLLGIIEQRGARAAAA
jgi:hypothetical protein